MTLPNPIGRQREVVYLPDSGHCVILGTAGSGKTSMAIIRAAFISKQNPDKKILLVTFNNTLVSYLRFLGEAELANVDIRTYHHFVQGYLKSKGRMAYHSIIGDGDRLKIIQQAFDKLKEDFNLKGKIWEKSADYFFEELRWMTLPHD